MKRFIYLCLFSALALNFAACNKENASENALKNETDSVSYCFGLIHGNSFKNVGKPEEVFRSVTLDKATFLKAFISAFNDEVDEATIKKTQAFMNEYQTKQDSTVSHKLLSEYFGMLNGYRLKPIGEHISFNKKIYTDAFSSAFNSETDKLLIPLSDAKAILNTYEMKIMKKRDDERQKNIAANKIKGAEFMEQNGQKPDVITLPSGLQIQHIVNGTGKTPAETDIVKVNYKGMLIDGTVFDQNNNIEFALDRLVPGFCEGITNMKEGGKAIFTMPYNLAYGEFGAGQMIEGGATLQFEVDLIQIVK